MRLTSKGRYADRNVRRCAQLRSGPVPLADISERQDFPFLIWNSYFPVYVKNVWFPAHAGRAAAICWQRCWQYRGRRSDQRG